MRNLKKTLCLVLALVFVLGLCTVGAADIAFTDEKDIQYKEAVQFMAGLGILNGYEDGSFKPGQNLTRAEAAKIIAYLVGGPSVENTPSEAVFTDVPVNDWANKYISYCYRKNIINGVGNNKFDPKGKVTRNAVMKMLLAACGYGSQGEFTGKDWEYEVFNKASETKLLQGFKASNYGEAATREEMAHLAYNAMMNVVLVTYSKNTGNYEPTYVNGQYNVTLAGTTWGIQTDVGVVIANKANSASAKGTELYGSRVQKYYVTEEDDNPNMLGHEVRITYRVETVNGREEAVAYFLEDKCTEVKGTEAARISEADTVFSFSSGQLVSYTVPARDARYTLPGTFVLNEDGKVLAYKTEGYFVSAIYMNTLTLQTTVVDPSTGQYVPVQAPLGAVNGDLVTVYHMGDMYTAKLCTRQSFVPITEMHRDTMNNNIYTYNNGAIVPSKAAVSYLPAGITRLDGTVQQLELNSTYTLWFDDKGGCVGFGDKGGSGSAVGADGYALVAYLYEGTDDFNTKAYFAQVIRGDGSRVDRLPISKTTYDTTTPGTVYKLTNYGSQWTLTPPGAEVAIVTYNANDPLLDYNSAAYIYYNGGVGSNLVTTVNRQKPQAGSSVIIVYTTEQSSYGYYYSVQKVRAVWFMNAASSVIPVSNSFIYVASTDPKGSSVVAGNIVTSYDGYLNGAAMSDLILTTPPTRIGFATYSKNSSTGVYTLSFLPDGNGINTGVRTVALAPSTDPMATPDCMPYNNNTQLALKDGNGNWQLMSLSGVTVKAIGAAEATMALYPHLTMNTMVDVFNNVASGLKVTITFVENVNSLNHSIGGGTIYVTSISN